MDVNSASDPAWFLLLQKNQDGAYLPTVANATAILSYDESLAGMLAYSAFTDQHLLLRPAPVACPGDPPLRGPYPRTWTTADAVLIQTYLQRVWNPRFTRATTEDAMLAVATKAAFHPVADWLEKLPPWDGARRAHCWLRHAFGTPDSNYHHAVAAKFLIAAVRRVRHPGCKFDHMLVLEGNQGIGKSTALCRLFGEEWFSDSIPSDLGGKDAAMALLGVWCLEFAEIDQLIRNDVETIKAFLSRAVDRYRPPYAKAYVERPRSGVLVGTTNSDDYLRDTTGNRRIWPVRCAKVNLTWLSASREQLWAEAAYRESQGESIWLNDAVQQDAAEIQNERMPDDPWSGIVAEWLIGKSEVQMEELLKMAIGIATERIEMRHARRMGAVMRTLGWKKTQVRRGEKTPKLWIRQNDATSG